ncbi:MAG: hypothetical protein ACXW29_07735, partial [Thermoanaerobaculia bacterium]
MDLQDLHISPAALISLIALLQFMILAAASAFSGKAGAKEGIRTIDLALMGSAAVFVVSLTLAHTSTAPKQESAGAHAQTSVVTKSSTPRGSCNSIRREMAIYQVEQNLGKADDVRSDEETRGPGAVVWIYRDSRCAVHMVEDKVEFVE